MGGTCGSAALTGALGLLERAVSYLLGSLSIVGPAMLSLPTPCTAWDLRRLLEHVDDSLLALAEAAELGETQLAVPARAHPAELIVSAVRDRATRLVGAWAASDVGEEMAVEGIPVSAALVCGTGAVEVTAHGWDIARACGDRRQVPPALAGELLDLAVLLASDADRPDRFAYPVEPPCDATPGDRFVAYLGRDPRR